MPRMDFEDVLKIAPVVGVSVGLSSIAELQIDGALYDRLDISERTVKAHLTRVFQRLDVTDRTQAALWAEREGLGPT